MEHTRIRTPDPLGSIGAPYRAVSSQQEAIYPGTGTLCSILGQIGAETHTGVMHDHSRSAGTGPDQSVVGHQGGDRTVPPGTVEQVDLRSCTIQFQLEHPGTLRSTPYAADRIAGEGHHQVVRQSLHLRDRELHAFVHGAHGHTLISGDQHPILVAAERIDVIVQQPVLDPEAVQPSVP